MRHTAKILLQQLVVSLRLRRSWIGFMSAVVLACGRAQ
jgi:hypothetical protein